MRRGLAHAWFVLGLFACGGEEPAQAPPPAAQSSGAELSQPRGGMAVEGIMGTIPERKVQAALEPKFSAFARCFARGAEQLEFIGGRMEFYFRVGLDGRVEWVYPRASTIGHRATEQCLLGVAQATRFPEPKGGGAAELAWSFEIDAADGVRPPVEWEADKLEAVLNEQRGVLEACAQGAGSMVVTVHVAPGGQVMAVGAAAGSREAAERIDCVVEAVQAWAMPDPGSYPAKISFAAP